VHFGGDALHLLGAATWLGGLPPLLILLRMQRNGWVAAPIVAATLRRFSTLAAAGVAALVLGAAVNAWFMVPTLGYLTESAYGRMVAAKLVLLAAMLAMAAHNRFVLVPRLGAGGGGSARATAALFRNAALELAAGCAVLLIVSVLGVTSP
jgi:putative copper resistance protein D